MRKQGDSITLNINKHYLYRGQIRLRPDLCLVKQFQSLGFSEKRLSL